MQEGVQDRKMRVLNSCKDQFVKERESELQHQIFSRCVVVRAGADRGRYVLRHLPAESVVHLQLYGQGGGRREERGELPATHELDYYRTVSAAAHRLDHNCCLGMYSLAHLLY